jgi:hypothetical protein
VRAPDGADRRPNVIRLLLAALCVLALVASGCGGGDDLDVATPSTTPDLTVPSAPASEAGGAGDETSTTSTTATNADEPAASGTGGATPDATGGATPAPAAPTPAAPAPTPDDTGGAAEPSTPAPQEDTGGAEAGGTSDFCAENPGAC